MDLTFKIYVIRKKGRKNLYLRLRTFDGSGDQDRSAGTHLLREAERAAARWEAELIAGTYKPRSSMSWAEFREKYEQLHVASLRDGSAGKIATVLNSIEDFMSPGRVGSVTSFKIKEWQAKLRADGKPETTIKSQSGTLKAALRWAAENGFIAAAPQITMPDVPAEDVMRGRPITPDEFVTLLRTVRKKFTGRQGREIRQVIRGLYWGGLRLGEAIALHASTGGFRVDLSGRCPMFRISASSEKGRRNRLLPMAPEFADFLLSSCPREGHIFDVRGSDGKRMGISRLSRVISDIGRLAKIETDPGRFVTAHDLRRSFGTRWARLVKPLILMQLMRHASISTTQKYYVALDAEETSDILYRSLGREKPQGDTLGDTTAENRRKS